MEELDPYFLFCVFRDFRG